MITRWVSDHFYENLSRGEHLFVDLITVVHDEFKRHYAYPGYLGGKSLALPTGYPEEKLSEAGDFCYRIGIYGKNFNGKTYLINFHFEPNDNEPISNLTLEKYGDR